MGNDGVMLNQDFIILMSKLITRDCRKCSNKVFVSRTATEYLERTPTNFIYIYIYSYCILYMKMTMKKLMFSFVLFMV